MEIAFSPPGNSQLNSGEAVNEPTVTFILQPKNLTRLDGAFTVSPDCVIATDAVFSDTGKILAERLRKATGYSINAAVQQGPDQRFPGGVIVLTTEKTKAGLGAEGYELQVTPAAATIRADTGTQPVNLTCQLFAKPVSMNKISPTHPEIHHL